MYQNPYTPQGPGFNPAAPAAGYSASQSGNDNTNAYNTAMNPNANSPYPQFGAAAAAGANAVPANQQYWGAVPASSNPTSLYAPQQQQQQQQQAPAVGGGWGEGGGGAPAAAAPGSVTGFQPNFMESQQNSYAAAATASSAAVQPATPAPEVQVPHQAPGGMDEEPIVRWSWNMYPVSRVDAAKMRVPLGCMYAPLERSCPVISTLSDRCAKCGGFLNPYVGLDLRTKTWTCVLCQQTNAFSQRYSQSVNEYNLPYELQPGHETVEYLDPKPIHPNQTFVLVVDTCVDNENELEGLRSCLQMVIDKLPQDAYICFITFSITIQIHDLSGKSAYARTSVLRGSEEVLPDHLKKLIPDLRPFVARLDQCRAVLDPLVSELAKDPWPVAKSHRPLRCTGAVLSAATSLLELIAPGRGSMILSFLSGACTVGPGMVVQPSREFMIRGHTDIRDNNENAALWVPSCSFYDALMQRLVAQGHSLSCFCASLDQLGVGEMKQCVHCSGGVVFNTETWSQEPFRQSIAFFLAPREEGKPLQFALNATFDVLTSPTWKVAGVIGQCVGTGKKSNAVSDKEIGAGGTCQWTTGLIDSRTTYAIYFHTASQPGGSGVIAPYRYTQFVTRYEIGNEVRVRVTTLCHPQKDKPSKFEIISAFDQETAAVLLAREAVFKTDLMPLFDVLRWLDRKLVSVVAEYAERVGGASPTIAGQAAGAASMRLPPEFVFFPAFMYHLRRSGYLQVFNSSPDESAIIRLQLLKSSVRDSIVQIQPTLYRYRMDEPPQPVSLDSSALQHDCVVLLDTFFEVLLHSGSTIAAWRNAGYAEQEDYAYFKEFLDTSMADAQMLVLNRVPVPRLIDVCQDDPDARILYNRINPSRSYNSAGADSYGSSEGELVYTDEASLQLFMTHLWKLAAQEK